MRVHKESGIPPYHYTIILLVLSLFVKDYVKFLTVSADWELRSVHYVRILTIDYKILGFLTSRSILLIDDPIEQRNSQKQYPARMPPVERKADDQIDHRYQHRIAEDLNLAHEDGFDQRIV